MKRIFHAWILAALVAACAAALAQGKGVGFNDTVITELVQKAFDSDPVLKKMHISVETHDRVVHLGGFVNSLAELERAGDIARRVEGVSAVRNTIRVTNRPSRA